MSFVLGESRGTKPCVFSAKVGPPGDERYFVCAAGADLSDLSFWYVLVCICSRTVAVASSCLAAFVCVFLRSCKVI